ncbi:MAG: GDSL-type esterase/lipase family protein [Treponema sp.]|jgi:acyl-CoA thioesterase-1|nr:GDSL-type esterase/lipase family protein [Treponema sp.]
MKKINFSFCLIGAIVFLCLNSCDNETTDNTGISVVCLGDSLTAGYGATTAGIEDKTRAYPAYLQNKINIPVVNAGISGDTTSQALSRINTDVLMENPRIVIIELGANDVFEMIPLATTGSNLQNIINLINDGNRKIYIAKFYTESVVRTMAGKLGITNYTVQTMLIVQYDNMFDRLASLNNVELIDDIWNGIWGIHMSDDVHPNARGYELMADNYYRIMKPYLRANNLIK